MKAREVRRGVKKHEVSMLTTASSAEVCYSSREKEIHPAFSLCRYFAAARSYSKYICNKILSTKSKSSSQIREARDEEAWADFFNKHKGLLRVQCTMII